MQTPRLLWCHRLHRSPNASSILVAQSQRVPFIARLQPLSPHWSVPGAIRRQMDYASTRKASVPHLVRTAAEPRQNRMYTVRLSHIDEVNPTVRLIQLTIPPHVQSLEGQDERADGEVSCLATMFCLYISNDISLIDHNHLRSYRASG